jgi:NADPH:quinone reductase-like Zn-dependent oxidoreductase
MGGHAEYVVLSDSTTMGIMPDAMSFTDAAALPFGGTTALHFLRGIDLVGKTVFINGASGAVGLCFLQIAKSRGAIVTTVTSTPNIRLMNDLGADTVIDYTTTDIMTTRGEYDVVIDCVNIIPLPLIERFVKKDGVVILLAGLIKEMFQSRQLKKAHVKVGPATVIGEQFSEINALYSNGKLRPIIDAVFPLEEISVAYARVDSGRKVGSVILTMGN